MTNASRSLSSTGAERWRAGLGSAVQVPKPSAATLPPGPGAELGGHSVTQATGSAKTSMATSSCCQLQSGTMTSRTARSVQVSVLEEISTCTPSAGTMPRPSGSTHWCAVTMSRGSTITPEQTRFPACTWTSDFCCGVAVSGCCGSTTFTSSGSSMVESWWVCIGSGGAGGGGLRSAAGVRSCPPSVPTVVSAQPAGSARTAARSGQTTEQRGPAHFVPSV